MPPSADLSAAIAAAIDARGSAYAPYSGFQVGASVIDEHGRVHSGCNVENAAYPEGTCAEAGAIAAMIRAGGRRIVAAVVAGPDATPCTPCGGCRQKLREFGQADLPVVIVGIAGDRLLTRSLAELLPDSFGPGHLG
ncbi:cytidine deaminase [Endobacter medicaginis]|uniref:Cytidine deaminase n=3 Tax=Endobacter medicaginis TaxID=1181271 RepID=A0A839UVU7_9PROT|nr:cytidine deaminase [Endobacter medicaginis]MBB3172504.1 cytidine deaminase [Endobacter medicaginis]MCX5474008.1 cytidine deaminase [Endobacter medicaginis]